MSEADPDREDEILQRSAEILANTEAIDDLEERAQRNRLERIMAPPAPAVVYKVTETPPPASASRKAALEAKHANGEPWTFEDRKHWWAAHCIEVAREINRLKPQHATDRLLAEIALVAIANSQARERLESRIAALEAAHGKPRVRVPAGRAVL